MPNRPIRVEQAGRVLADLVPLIEARGQPNGGLTRYVAPPGLLTLQVERGRRRLDGWCGRLRMLSVMWNDHGIHVGFWRGGDWLRELLALR